MIMIRNWIKFLSKIYWNRITEALWLKIKWSIELKVNFSKVSGWKNKKNVTWYIFVAIYIEFFREETATENWNLHLTEVLHSAFLLISLTSLLPDIFGFFFSKKQKRKFFFIKKTWYHPIKTIIFSCPKPLRSLIFHDITKSDWFSCENSSTMDGTM